MSRIGPPAIEVRGVTIADETGFLCRDVSLSVPAPSAYALMGQTSAAEAFLGCLAGKRRVARGSITLFGIDPARRWKLRSRRGFVPQGGRVPDLAAARSRPDLMLLEAPAPSREARSSLRKAVSAGMTLFLTTSDAEIAADLADHGGILAHGRLVCEGPIDEIAARFRRIRFVTRSTETRTSFGTELDEFDAVRVRVRGWGIEAVVSNFEAAAFQRLSAADGVTDASVEPMTLAEIIEACQPEGG